MDGILCMLFRRTTSVAASTTGHKVYDKPLVEPVMWYPCTVLGCPLQSSRDFRSMWRLSHIWIDHFLPVTDKSQYHKYRNTIENIKRSTFIAAAGQYSDEDLKSTATHHLVGHQLVGSEGKHVINKLTAWETYLWMTVARVVWRKTTVVMLSYINDKWFASELLICMLICQNKSSTAVVTAD